MLVAMLLLASLPTHAAYVQRFSTITNGAITFTGNTLGLDKTANANAPGTSGAIGTFITTDTTVTDGTFPAGTTANWAVNRSSAVLQIPAGSTVLYAELIWSGSYSYGGETVAASLNNAVTLTTPAGTASVAPGAATAQTLGTAGAGGTCTTGPCYYVRSADVTALVQAGGAGTYTAGGVPGTQSNTENSANAAGWTLAVVYGNASLPARNLTLFTGAEVAGSAAATISGFCTPPTGPRSGRLLVSALEGDAGIAGDQMQFGPTAATLAAVSGANNPIGNFFAGQINGNTGALDTSGTFGTRNHTPGAPSSGARQGYDITNVDVSATLANSQTSAAARGTTTGDQYMINALGLQINVGAPSFLVTTKSVNKTTTVVGDTLTYTIVLNNTGGTADASSVVFSDTPPPGTSFVAGSFTLNGVTNGAANPAAGVNLGTVAAGGTATVTFQVTVNSIPATPATAVYSNTASWTYQFISCAGQPATSGSITTNAVATNIARLAISKAVSPTGTVQPGNTLTYTMTLANDGTAASSGSTLTDPIPAGTTYAPNSTTLNGVAVADIAGVMPFASSRVVNSAGQAAGVIAAGQAATVIFQVTVNNSTVGTVTNTATGDIDGAGAAPSNNANVSNTVQPVADLSVTKSNSVTQLFAGDVTVYRLTVSNAGPSAANGALLRDAAATGLSCTAITCVAAAATGGATCPASGVTIALLQGSGIALTSLPANSSLAFDLTCTVTATGL